MDCHHCLLCGSCSDLSLHATQATVDLIVQRYARGPLAYPAAVGWDKAHMCLCRPCFQQLRRTNGGKGVPRTKQPLPLDATLLQTVVPGLMRQQDARTRERMCGALRAPGNGYSRSFEAIRALMREGEEPLLSRWWEHNLRTEFFSHKATARLLRKSSIAQ
jgi:hypothetical protein